VICISEQKAFTDIASEPVIITVSRCTLDTNKQDICCAKKIVIIVYCVEPFLCNDRETGKYTMAVFGQRLGKHVPAKRTTEQHPLLGSRFLIM
jgi:hypothetical protein